MLLQDGLVPPLELEEASGTISGREQILKHYAKKVSLTAKDVITLIEDVLHNPYFNANEVDLSGGCRGDGEEECPRIKTEGG